MGVNLEMIRMSLYVTFPIVMFYMANSKYILDKPQPKKITEAEERKKIIEETLQEIKRKSESAQSC